MSRVRRFFLQEATHCLGVLRDALSAGDPDAPAAYGAARLLRGSAQMARYGAIARQAEALEQTLKRVSRGDSVWTPEVAAMAGRRIEELERAVEAVRAGRVEADPRMEAAMAVEQGVGVPVVPVEELEYRGRRALERALELRAALEEVIVTDQHAGPLLDELFDLVRLGIR